MPHLLYDSEDLDALYPKLEMPDEDLLDDEHERIQDRADSTFMHGLKVAAKIQTDMREVGRIRHPQMRPTPRPPASQSQTAPQRQIMAPCKRNRNFVEMLKSKRKNQYRSLTMTCDAALTTHRRSEKQSSTVSSAISVDADDRPSLEAPVPDLPRHGPSSGTAPLQRGASLCLLRGPCGHDSFGTFGGPLRPKSSE